MCSKLSETKLRISYMEKDFISFYCFGYVLNIFNIRPLLSRAYLIPLTVVKELYVCGSCPIPLSTPHSVLCDVDNGMPQLSQT